MNALSPSSLISAMKPSFCRHLGDAVGEGREAGTFGGLVLLLSLALQEMRVSMSENRVGWCGHGGGPKRAQLLRNGIPHLAKEGPALFRRTALVTMVMSIPRMRPDLSRRFRESDLFRTPRV